MLGIKIFEINVKTAFLLAKAAVPYMEERKQGSIIFVSSMAGFMGFSVGLLEIDLIKNFLIIPTNSIKICLF